jgi:hypothetical protein
VLAHAGFLGRDERREGSDAGFRRARWVRASRRESSRAGTLASLTRVLLLDLLLYILQTTSLIISYVNSHASKLPRSASLPYDDLLLPTDASAVVEIDAEDVDLESGEGFKRRGRRRDPVDEDGEAEEEDDDEIVWLNEGEEDELIRGELLTPATVQHERVLML